jgi:hypothetical protein
MARLFHDRPLRRPRNRGAVRASGPERVARVLPRIEARAHCEFLDDARQVNA